MGDVNGQAQSPQTLQGGGADWWDWLREPNESPEEENAGEEPGTQLPEEELLVMDLLGQCFKHLPALQELAAFLRERPSEPIPQ